MVELFAKMLNVLRPFTIFTKTIPSQLFDKVRNKIPLDITLSVDQILTELAAKSQDSLPGHLLQNNLTQKKRVTARIFP